MLTALVLVLLAIVLGALVVVVRRSHAALAEDLRIIRVAVADVAGRQLRLSDEYAEVHKILAAIRDLNQAELQDRKEILQRSNITASSRVVQVRAQMQQLEEAALRELEGLNG